MATEAEREALVLWVSGKLSTHELFRVFDLKWDGAFHHSCYSGLIAEIVRLSGKGLDEKNVLSGDGDESPAQEASERRA